MDQRPLVARAGVLGWMAAGVICAAYVTYFLGLREFPLQDFPNHLARAAVIADLLFHHGARFGQTYTLSLLPVPYVLHDLLSATLVEILGLQAGGAVFCVITLLSLPLALLFYLRVTGLAPRAAPLVLLLGLYLTTDFFFYKAFMSFRLALAMLVVSMGLIESLRREWTRGAYVAYILSVIIGYLTHLTTPTFLAITLGVSSTLRLRQRSTAPARELALWLPLALVWATHFGIATAAHLAATRAAFATEWNSWQQKLQLLWLEFSRYRWQLELPLRILFIVCLLWPLRRLLTADELRRAGVIEPLSIALVFLAFYMASPESIAHASYVDARALPVITVMLLLAALNVPDPTREGMDFSTRPALALGSLLAVANLLGIAHQVGKNEAFLAHYRALGAAIPPGSYVLPIQTIPSEGHVKPFLHAAAYLVPDRSAIIPYLFSGDRGDPVVYFRYRNRPYQPEEEWYKAQPRWQSSWYSVDWNRVACGYDYLIMTLPVDMSLIGVPTRPVLANDAASVVAVDRSACHPQRITSLRVAPRPFSPPPGS